MINFSKNQIFLMALSLFFMSMGILGYLKMQKMPSRTVSTLAPGQMIQGETGSLFMSMARAPKLSFTTDRDLEWQCPLDLKRWSVFFFGYAQCPAFCPTILEKMDQIGRLMPKGTVDFYFVSIDPEQDSPQALREFLSKYHTPITGLTGSQEAMHTLADFLKLHVEEATQKEEHIEHASSLAILSPQGYPCGLLSDLTVPSRVVNDLKKLISIAPTLDVPQELS